MQGFWDTGRFPQDQRWPGVVQNTLTNRVDIIEAGHPGRTTIYENRAGGGNRNGLTALSIYLESHCPLDAVVLMLGTNDLHAHYSQEAQVVAWNLSQLIKLILNTPCGRDAQTSPHLLVVAPPLVVEQGFAAEAMAGAAKKSAKFGACFRDLASHYDADFLDAADIISADPLDGIHLSAESHITLGQAIAEKLVKSLGLHIEGHKASPSS